MSYKIKSKVEDIPLAAMHRFRAFVIARRFNVLGVDEDEGARQLNEYYNKWIGSLDACTKCNRMKLWNVLKEVVKQYDEHTQHQGTN